MMPPQLARAKRRHPKARGYVPKPLVEQLQFINANDLNIPRDHRIYSASSWLNFKYPLATLRLAYHAIEATHPSGTVQVFKVKHIRTNFGWPRPALICSCGQPVIRLYFHNSRLACRYCIGATYASRTLNKQTRPALQLQRLRQYIAMLPPRMRHKTRNRLNTRCSRLEAQSSPQKHNSKRLDARTLLPQGNYATYAAIHWQ
jgi:hypothetical protein